MELFLARVVLTIYFFFHKEEIAYALWHSPEYYSETVELIKRLYPAGPKRDAWLDKLQLVMIQGASL